MRVWPVRPYPLGATWDVGGVNFSLFSQHATRVDLCLFDAPDAQRESCCIWAGVVAEEHYALQGRSAAVFRLIARDGGTEAASNGA